MTADMHKILKVFLLLPLIFVFTFACTRAEEKDDIISTITQDRIEELSKEFSRLAIAPIWVEQIYIDLKRAYMPIGLNRFNSLEDVLRASEVDYPNKAYIKYVVEYDIPKKNSSNKISKWHQGIVIKEPSDPVLTKQIKILIPELEKMGVSIKLASNEKYNIRINSFCYDESEFEYVIGECIITPTLPDNFVPKYKVNIPTLMYGRDEGIVNSLYKVFVKSPTKGYYKNFADDRVADLALTKLFTSNEIPKTSGLIYSASDGAIQFAECFIFAGHTEKVKKFLASECLIRSLGLTNSGKMEDTVLGMFRILGSIGGPSERSNIDYDFLSNINNMSKDLLMVSVLYDPRIKIGMTADAVSVISREVLREKILTRGNNYERVD